MATERIEIGQADLSAMIPYLDRAKDLEKAVLEVRDIRPNATNHLTARFIDENQPAGIRTYMHAYGHISNAFELADALWALLNGDQGLTPRAPWTLMRSILESSFWATWLLDSDSSLVRRRRGLIVELVDRRELQNWIDAVPSEIANVQDLGMSRKSRTVYENECEALKMAWKVANRKPNVVDELRSLSISRRGEDIGSYFVMAWRSLSGLQHGHVYALQLNGDMDLPSPVPGGQNVRVSVNDDSFVMLCKTTYALLLEAAELFVSRSMEPQRSRCPLVPTAPAR